MKKVTLSKAKLKAWKAFSRYIRIRASEKGLVLCYTCGRKYEWEKMQTGHWIEGHANAVFINEDYVRPQCLGCNTFHGGRQGEFRDKLRKEIGNKEVDRLIKEAHEIIKLTVEDYLELERWYIQQGE